MRYFSLLILILALSSCTDGQDWETFDLESDRLAKKEDISALLLNSKKSSGDPKDFIPVIQKVVANARQILNDQDKLEVLYNYNEEFFDLSKVRLAYKNFNSKCHFKEEEFEYIGYFLDQPKDSPTMVHIVFDARHDCNNFSHLFSYYVTSDDYILYTHLPFSLFYENDFLLLVRNDPDVFGIYKN